MRSRRGGWGCKGLGRYTYDSELTRVAIEDPVREDQARGLERGEKESFRRSRLPRGRLAFFSLRHRSEKGNACIVTKHEKRNECENGSKHRVRGMRRTRETEPPPSFSSLHSGFTPTRPLQLHPNKHLPPRHLPLPSAPLVGADDRSADEEEAVDELPEVRGGRVEHKDERRAAERVGREIELEIREGKTERRAGRK